MLNNSTSISTSKLETIYGIHAITSKLKHKPQQLVELLVLSHSKLNKRIEKIIASANRLNIPVKRSTDSSIFTDNIVHQGIIATCKPNNMQGLAQLDAILSSKKDKFCFLILDGVTDPHNLGACLRTSAAAEVDALIVPAHGSASLNETVSKVACGGADLVPVIGVNNLARTIKILQQAGVWVVGTAADAKQSIYQLDLNMSIAWVLGAEGKGMRPLTAKLCDYAGFIPIASEINSLNVSVATGVCLFETMRQWQG